MSLYEVKPYIRPVGGVNYVSGETNLREYDLEDAANVDFDLDGSIQSRSGTLFKGRVRNFKTTLLSWWRLEEAANTLRRDQAQGRNHLGDVLGNVARVTGFEGSFAAQFSGSNYLKLDAASNTNLHLAATNSSIAFWYRSVAHAATQTLIYLRDGGGNNGWQIIDNGGNLQASVISPGQVLSAATTAALDDDAWHHVVFTFKEDTGELKSYVDGALDQTDNAFNPQWLPYTADVFVGVNPALTAFSTATLDDISVWTTLLDAAAVTSLFNSGAPGGTATFADNGASRKLLGLFQYSPRGGGADEILAVAGGLVLRYEEADMAFLQVPFPSNYPGPIDTDARVSFAQMNDRLYFGNGVDPNFRYEGSLKLFTMGLDDAGTNKLTALSQQAGGNVEADNDYYYYRLIPVRQIGGGRTIAGRPGDESAAIQMAAGPNQTIRSTLPTPATPDAGQTHWGVYRAKVPSTATPRPMSAFKFIEDVAINPGGTYNDTTSQANADATGDNLSAYFNNRKHPPCTIFQSVSVNQQDTIWLAGDPSSPVSLYPSDPTHGADVYLLTSEQFVGRDENDIITGIARFYDHMVIFKNDRIFLGTPTFTGGDFDWRIVLSHAGVGCESHFSIQSMDDLLIWKDERGLYTLRGVDAFGNVRVQRVSNKIAPKLADIPGLRRPHIVSAHIKTPRRRHYRFAYSIADAGPNDKMFLYDYDHITPDPEDNQPVGAYVPITGVKAEVMANVENNVTGLDEIWIGDDDGNVMVMDTGTVDQTHNGTAVVTSPINSFFETQHYDHAVMHATKRWRELVLYGETTGGPMNVSWRVDFRDEGGGSTSFSLNIIGKITSKWDAATWDTAQWGGIISDSIVGGRIRLARATGHHIQLRFSASDENAAWKLHNWSLGAVVVPSTRVRQL